MTDLVTILRRDPPIIDSATADDIRAISLIQGLMNKAADEIERLTKQQDYLAGTVEVQAAEIERLKALLPFGRKEAIAEERRRCADAVRAQISRRHMTPYAALKDALDAIEGQP